ncbi:hypothetical protein [Burkholderia gladioli]|uniref:hypothetical protein n=1 Tax=Burkholderia gladioli TaxID=28095 RepID=UPI001640D178|nr:hypothetical protein [Burkholderia gladioli]
MTVPVQNPSISYVGNGATNAFAFPFTILDSSDLVVLLDGVEQTVGSQYTINGIGNQSGGTATFLSTPSAGANITLYRDVSIERDTDYQDNGDLLAKTVNDDFDRLWMAMQDGNFGLTRAVRVPRSDVNPNMELPSAVLRANKALGFDNAGNPFAIELIIGSVTVPVVSSIAMLRLISKLSTTTVLVTGYYKPCDGGGGAYRLDDTAPPGSVADNGGTVIVGADGGIWRLQLTGTVSIMQFGARSGDIADGIDVADNTARIQACLNCGLGQWEVPEGRFMFDDLTIPFVLRFVLYGSGPGSTLVQMGGGIHFASLSINCFDSKGTIRNLNFEGTHGTANTLDTSFCQTLDILDVSFKDTPVGLTSLKLDGNPISGTYAHDVRVDNIRIYSETAGNAGIALGSWHSDSSISNFWMNGFFQVNYCLYAEVNAQTTYVCDSHPYNAKINVVRLNGNNSHFRWNNCTFDYAGQHTFNQIGSVNGKFTHCFFQSTTPGNCALIFDNSYNNNLSNIEFEAPFGVATAAFQEINGSSGNKMTLWQIDDPAHWTSQAAYAGDGSWVRGSQNYGKYDTIFQLNATAKTAQAQGTIVEYGANGGGGFLNEAWAVQESYALKVIATVDNPPPAGETMTFSLRKNGVAIAGGVITAGQTSVVFGPSPQNYHPAGARVSIQSVFSPGSGSASPAISIVMIG